VIEKRFFLAVGRLDGAWIIDPLDTAGRVLGLFLEKANDQPILGTRKG
jgi:hypothetical protein